ncbi:hypothetical protein [Paenirhodobacter sp. CAU 1674]|uniref:hypothetical protein n=1 Tax=Paenirhodobacter sp. CAU 1674 TaxID=3032596 RepID=UPI0023DBBF27|nr:hypothetical protein [Paenirhodobacter sp. CAU 1674]MDF2141220.1 hypothetical protein [Paenirhodobacter sp. CAU 1674]
MVDRHHPGQAPTAVLNALAAGACRTIEDLGRALDLTARQVSDAASCLIRRDYLERMAAGCYQLTPAGIEAAARGEIIKSGPKAPSGRVREQPNTLRERAWRSMRMRRRFTVLDLVADAATASDGNPTDNLQRYLRALRRAGFVVEFARRAEASAPTSNGYKRWMLSRDTGPRAPVVLSKVRAVHDFNTGEDVPCNLP